MNKLLLILFTFFLISLKEPHGCEMMKAGTFLVETKSTTALGHKIKINGDSFEITDESGLRHGGEFVWVEDCTFLLEDREKEKQSGNKIEQTLNSAGPIYYQITKVKGDTLYFEITRNLHIHLGSGKFIRLKN